MPCCVHGCQSTPPVHRCSSEADLSARVPQANCSTVRVQGALTEAIVMMGTDQDDEQVVVSAAPGTGVYAAASEVGTRQAQPSDTLPAVQGALAEAALMMGMERNGEVVRMAAYAPLLVNEHDHWYWTNLIAFNATQCALLPAHASAPGCTSCAVGQRDSASIPACRQCSVARALVLVSMQHAQHRSCRGPACEAPDVLRSTHSIIVHGRAGNLTLCHRTLYPTHGLHSLA